MKSGSSKDELSSELELAASIGDSPAPSSKGSSKKNNMSAHSPRLFHTRNRLSLHDDDSDDNYADEEEVLVTLDSTPKASPEKSPSEAVKVLED